MKKQQGFTLVEIAIVMVIIGLLLGGVLKGQEIITNARVKNVENDFNGVTAAIYSYQDRYRSLPGDDGKAVARWTNVSDPILALATTSNGKIEGDFDDTATGDESQLLWLHLRNAKLISGSTTDQNQPKNSFGGLTGVSTGTLGTGGTNVTIPWLFIGFTGIPGNIATILEARLDDENPLTGSIQADIDISTAATAPYKESLYYRVYFNL
ncbi:MAG: prepilin-type N-terminal cleavage/methylation domain-containing protein [Thiomargarita sp.]|nr:prepilin-type N-terminal cleavage/methylation domain-containing protein [Thiomargarita sp.]